MTLAQQEGVLRYYFPKVRTWRRVVRGATHLCFRLNLKPTPTSDNYSVLFVYAVGDRPLVWVDSPPPQVEMNGEPTPHLNADGTLCLFDPTKREWSPADALARTIVQWTVRWLFHYEHWITFGEWRGDAVPPEPTPKPPEGAAITLADIK